MEFREFSAMHYTHTHYDKQMRCDAIERQSIRQFDGNEFSLLLISYSFYDLFPFRVFFRFYRFRYTIV